MLEYLVYLKKKITVYTEDTIVEKAKKIEMKSFKLNSREEYIIYLQNIIAITYKALDKHKRYLKKLNQLLIDIREKNAIHETNNITVDYFLYSEFVDLLGNVEGYLLNIIGDCQKSSISYYKFRNLLLKKKKKGDIDFEIRELDEDIKSILGIFNKMRNWQNHVPESLLTSEIELIKQGRLLSHETNPIEINLYSSCTLEYIEDLYNSSYKFNKQASKILQSMKKDYSCLINESMRIVRRYSNNPCTLKRTIATKLSAEVQGLPINNEI